MSLARLPLCADVINKHFDHYSLIDLGCRTMDLKPLLKSCDQYFGTDFNAGDGVIECNLEKGLPQFEDGAFDIVTALDVLEHLDNAHWAYEEALRVAKKAVFVSLPNMYYIKFRLNFLLGNGLSGKYTFPDSPIKDRHRWVLSYKESVDFIYNNSKDYEITTYKINPTRGRTKLVSEPIEKILSDNFPNAFCYGALFMIKKTNQ